VQRNYSEVVALRMTRHTFLVVTFLALSGGCQLFAQTKLPVPPSGISDSLPTIEKPVTVEGGYEVPPPRSMTTPDPKIPNDGIKGTVLIKCIVGVDGKVHEPSVIKSLSLQNDRTAIEAVRNWRFFPTKFNGKTVAVRTTLAVVF
jgi:TonB family protein